MLCIFDCETILDTELIRESFGISGDDISVSKEAMRIYKEKNNTDFLPVVYHKVVAISAVVADNYGKFKAVGNFPKNIENPSEKDLIDSFLTYIDTQNPRLISFNGRGFDLPMLFVRAMRYNLSCRSFFETENQSLKKSKWDNYRVRYSEKFHLDLFDVINNYGALRGLNLDILCKASNIPGKFDVSGDNVLELYYQNRLDKIREYCESDVLNTYWLYLKYELLNGNLEVADYGTILEDFRERLPKDKSYSNKFIDYIDSELDRLMIGE